MEKCCKMFRNQINFDNAPDVLIMAHQLQVEEIKNIAINRITNNRNMLMADPDFRKKMMEHPEILLLLYDKLCQNNDLILEEMSSSLNSQSSNSSTCSLWTCVCGSTATGHYCSWCGYASN